MAKKPSISRAELNAFERIADGSASGKHLNAAFRCSMRLITEGGVVSSALMGFSEPTFPATDGSFRLSVPILPVEVKALVQGGFIKVRS